MIHPNRERALREFQSSRCWSNPQARPHKTQDQGTLLIPISNPGLRPAVFQCLRYRYLFCCLVQVLLNKTCQPVLSHVYAGRLTSKISNQMSMSNSERVPKLSECVFCKDSVLGKLSRRIAM